LKVLTNYLPLKLFNKLINFFIKFHFIHFVFL